jgi:hypothetical protein
VDGLFDSTDLVQVFQRGEFEDALAGNSSWADGDWTGDGECDSGDLVAAFQRGGYEAALGASGNSGVFVTPVPEPGGAVLALAAVALLFCRRFHAGVA